MMRSRFFWRLFVAYGLLIVVSLGIIGFFLHYRIETLLEQSAADSLRARSVLQEERDTARRIVWATVGFTTILALTATYFLARRLFGPIDDLSLGVDRIATGAYGYKVLVTGEGEVETLARNFNNMSERLAQQFTQLEEDRQQLRAILSGMAEGVVALDADQRVLFSNDRAAQLLEFQHQVAVGRKVWEVVRHRPIQELVRGVMENSRTQTEELHLESSTKKDLSVYAARLSGSPSRGAVLVIQDMSELRRLERVRQEFIANVSHELKTPLAVIKVTVETLLDGVDNDQDRTSFLQHISEQAERLHLLILDMLSLARIETGEEVFDFQDVPLEPLVQHCFEHHRKRAQSKQQSLIAVAPDNDETSVWADEEALGQILDNLVDNALKYTPKGGSITVRWRVEGARVFLEVEDTGIGIPERDLPRVFERFYRVDKARSRELGGTGLGLSIVKHQVQAMKGTIRAESEVGRGSVFRIELPKAPSPTNFAIPSQFLHDRSL